jgi:putative spermidine/putrescine transport system substrate-binding protein
MKRRQFLKYGSLVTGAAAMGFAPFVLAADKPDSISIMTWGGHWGDALAKGVDAKYTKEFGIKVLQDRGSSPVERITKLKINLGNQIYDLVQLHDGLFPLAVEQGVLEPINRSSAKYTHLVDVYPNFIHDNWVAQIFSAIGLCYNTKEVKNPPTSWADLWRPEFKGRIVLPDISHSIGPDIIAIGAIADGKDPKDAAAGFEMLRKMVKLNPIFAKDTDTIMSSLANGEAVIGLLYKSQTFTVRDRGGPVDWVFPKEGAISISWGTGIAKNTKHKDAAEKYINLTLDPEGQTFFTKAFNYPGTNKKMLALLDPKLRERVQFTEYQIGHMIELDHKFMSEHRKEWVDQWNRIVAGG